MSLLDMIMGKQPNPTGLTPIQQRQSMMGGPAPISTPRGENVQQPSFFERLGSGAMDYLSDPTNRARLAAGFNTMRLNPDPNIAKMAQSQIETAQAMELLKGQGNKTAEWLEANGYKEEAALVRQNPAIAKDVISKVMTQRGKGGLTDAFRTKMLEAEAAGLVEGTPEYQKFMGADTAYGGLSGEALDSVSKLRTEFQGLPITKNFQENVQAIGRIYSSVERPSAAGDLALIFNYMKILDPGSVVRESEFQVAENARAWMTKMESKGYEVPSIVAQGIQRIESGERLLPEQRDDFVRTATSLYQNSENKIQDIFDQYAGLIKPYVGDKDPASQLIDFRFKHRLYQTPEGVDPVLWEQMSIADRAKYLSLGNK